MTRRQAIIDELERRIGAAFPGWPIYIGRAPRLGPNDPDGIAAISTDDDELDPDLPGMARQWGIEILLLRRVDEQRAVETDIGELVEAVEADRRLGGLAAALTLETVSIVEREDGAPGMGAVVRWNIAYERRVGSL